LLHAQPFPFRVESWWPTFVSQGLRQDSWIVEKEQAKIICCDLSDGGDKSGPQRYGATHSQTSALEGTGCGLLPRNMVSSPVERTCIKGV
jgi:hypothetical protein